MAFDKVASATGDIAGRGWVSFPPYAHGGNNPPLVPVGSGIYDLLYDMDYGWTWYPGTPDTVTMQLTGLTLEKYSK